MLLALRDSYFIPVRRFAPQPMASGDFDPERLLSVLRNNDVDFVLIGGMAAVLHGDVGVTVDVDIVPEKTMGNLERLALALRELQSRIRTEGEPDGLAFDCSAAFFKNLPEDSFVNLTTSAGDLDVTFRPAGTSGYPDLADLAVRVETAEHVEILVASLADVIRSKEAADREKDRQALPRLRRLLALIQKRE
jgi:hypothetical protein